MSIDAYLISFVLFLAFAGWYRWRTTRLPEGVPQHRQPLRHTFRATVDSDIIYLRVFGTQIIVLNSQTAANDLLSARSLLYSDRQVSMMVTELLGWGRMASTMPYRPAWRTSRHAIWQEFNPNNLSNHRPKQLWHARDLIRRLLTTPDDFLHHIDYTLAASVIALTYGINVKPEHDPTIERGKKALRQLQKAAIAGTYLVDLIPILKHVPSWMPGAGFKAYAEQVLPDTIAMIDIPYNEGCSLIREGNGGESLLSRNLARVADSNYDHAHNTEIIKDVAAQRKGQEELDKVASSRLPSFEDLPHMPYVQAIMLEVLRWQAVLPLGLAHRLTIDDEYKGYYIPKGSIVFANIWAMLRDEEYYPDPDVFRPEGFLKDGKINYKLTNPIPNFGFGRRICPGRYFAMDSLWISIASILATFDIEKAKDEQGQDIEPDIQWIPGFSRQLRRFKCSITARSAEAIKLIKDSELA
ncbi:cytochrome P450 [Pleurotus eryngii]|uniref:Cytochrome P450 n=1 Tax=Pleurotus eryngii TaxID=5323 RepID=A0A9P5ZMV5_PLEER|nr:cytochrome P450 [Pleurotus eryngii]